MKFSVTVKTETTFEVEAENEEDALSEGYSSFLDHAAEVIEAHIND